MRMTTGRFKALANERDCWDIIDYDESEKINGFVIYNDLGNIYFSSAPQLSDLLNELNNENEQLKLQMINMEEDRDYFKSKASSLEEGYIKLQDHEIRLKKEVKSLLKSIQNNECLKNVECFKVFNTILDLIE